MREFPMVGSLYIYPASDELKPNFTRVWPCFSTEVRPLEYGLTDVDGILVLRLLGSQTEPMMALLCPYLAGNKTILVSYCPEPPRIWAT